MREKFIALAMCGLLAMTLFACGENRGVGNDSDILGDEQNYTNGTTNGGSNGSSRGSMNGSTKGGMNGNTNGGSTNGRMSGSMNGTNGTNSDQSSAMGDSALRGSTINPANGGADRTATWEQMLQNGRVHDMDGFLMDNENSHWA